SDGGASFEGFVRRIDLLADGDRHRRIVLLARQGSGDGDGDDHRSCHGECNIDARGRDCNMGLAFNLAEMPVTPPETAFLFDLDGTSVDMLYDHVLAWHHALVAEGIELSFWRIHRKIGMSGGLFTNMLLRETGFEISEEPINRLRQLHAEFYSRRSETIR